MHEASTLFSRHLWDKCSSNRSNNEILSFKQSVLLLRRRLSMTSSNRLNEILALLAASIQNSERNFSRFHAANTTPEIPEKSSYRFSASNLGAQSSSRTLAEAAV